MSESLDERTRRYVTPDAPLGPIDASFIEDLEVAARLFDIHNTSFSSLLRKDLSVIIGRRGSGKTALLNCYKVQPYLTAEDIVTGGPRSDFATYDFVIEVSTPDKFQAMQRVVVKDPEVFTPVESIVEDWRRLIIDYFLATLVCKTAAGTIKNQHLLAIHHYLVQDEDSLKDELRRQVWEDDLWAKFKDFAGGRKGDRIGHLSLRQVMDVAIEYLKGESKRVVIVIDSMDEYGTGRHLFDRTVGALVRFVCQFNRTYDRVKIKLVLPSEIFPEVQAASANPLKDLVSFDQVQWSAAELMQIAAHRYQIFLSMHDPGCLEQMGRLNLNRRDEIRKFWSRFFPKTRANQYGTEEESLTYLLRHTQLLPRQVLMILQKIVMDSFNLTGGYRRFSSKIIGAAIESIEPIIAAEIFTAFRYVYDFAPRIGKAVFGNSQTIFSYDELEDKWRKKGRSLMSKIRPDFEMVDFSDMLIRMGIMGLVVDAEETERYYQGEFGYSLLTPFNIGGGNQLCLHPIFSKFFNASGNAKSKAILPKGVNMEL